MQSTIASRDSVEVRHQIDSAVNELSTLLSFVTFMNVFYCLLVIYAFVGMLYAIIVIKRLKYESSIIESRLKSVKVEK